MARWRGILSWAVPAAAALAIMLLTAYASMPAARFRRALARAEDVGVSLKAHADDAGHSDPQATARMASAITLAARAAGDGGAGGGGTPPGKNSSAMVELRRLLLDSLEAEGNAFAEEAPFSSGEALAHQSYRWYQLREAVRELALAEVGSGDAGTAHLWPLVLLEIGAAYGNCQSPNVFRFGLCNADADAKELAEAVLMRTRLTQPQLRSLQEAFEREQKALSARGVFERFIRRLARDTRPGLLGIGDWKGLCDKAESVEAAATAFEACLRPPWEQYRFTQPWEDAATKRALEAAAGSVQHVEVSDAEWLARVVRRCVETKAALCLAQVAIAVERYTLKYDTWPDDLGQLAPEFLCELPPDPMTGMRISYATGEFGAVVWAGPEQNVGAWGTKSLQDLANGNHHWAFVVFNGRGPQGGATGDGRAIIPRAALP